MQRACVPLPPEKVFLPSTPTGDFVCAMIPVHLDVHLQGTKSHTVFIDRSSVLAAWQQADRVRVGAEERKRSVLICSTTFACCHEGAANANVSMVHTSCGELAVQIYVQHRVGMRDLKYVSHTHLDVNDVLRHVHSLRGIKKSQP